jgi:phosphate transport system protein
LARDIIAGDAAVNDLRFSIEDQCSKLIVQQQPKAIDLRKVVAFLVVILDLERMGDHAVGVAKMAIQLEDQPWPRALTDLPHMAEICQTMLRRSVDALLEIDQKLAQRIITQDDEVDALYNQVFRQIVHHMLTDSHVITSGMFLLFAAHNLERIADRVTNICERVTFISTGQMEEIPTGKTNLSLDEKDTKTNDE